MKIDFSELKGLSSYTFKKDKGVFVKFAHDSKKKFNTETLYFMVINGNGEVLYKSKKNCFEFRVVKEYKNVSQNWFPKYEPVYVTRLKFKADKKGYSKHLSQFRNFCSNRKSGSEIYEILMDSMRKYKDFSSHSLEQV